MPPPFRRQDAHVRHVWHNRRRPHVGTANSNAWKTIDEHHLESLGRLLDARRLAGLYTEQEVASLSLVWHRLSPWPDVVDGLAKLRTAGGILRLATLTNGKESLAKGPGRLRGNLDLDAVFCADTFRLCKPHLGTYLGAAREIWGLEPGQVAMMACHMG
ncbi:hypothetical protein E4U41_000347 [Claviceps citrina]|nr:hypothetical protein E4U41_000347 [Claviceps citrina]